VNLSEYARYDATGLAELIRTGQVGAAEVQAVARAAIELVKAKLNAVVDAPFDAALDYAAQGPFAGVPFAIKDLGVHAADIPFAMGSRLARNVRLPYDSELMARFRRAGLATLARTTTPEFGLSPSTEPVATGPTRNPWDLARTTGGSSGGSAALVAAGALPLAHGGDGGGSLRTPASCCGLVGLKPSRGRTPVGPDTGEAVAGLAVDSVLTRSVRDIAAVLDAIHGAGAGDRFIAPPPARPYRTELTETPPPLRVAIAPSGWFGLPVDGECVEAVAQVGRQLRELGHQVEEACFTVELDEFVAAFEVPFAAMLAATIDELAAALRITPGPDNLEALTLTFAEVGRRLTYTDFHRGAGVFNTITRRVVSFFDDYDLLLTPTLAQLAVSLGTFDTTDAGHTARGWITKVCHFLPSGMLVNVTGQPAISLPLCQSSNGLPIGVQVIARYADEATLIAVAAQLEEAMPWSHRVPQVHATR
jgi:amidase